MLHLFPAAESGLVPVSYLTTDLDLGSTARDLASGFGFDLHVLFPKEGLPKDGVLIVGLDELMLDAPGRRDYLA